MEYRDILHGWYELSEYGELITQGRAKGRQPGKRVKVRLDDRGYHRVALSIHGYSRVYRVHRLVCEAWHGPPEAGQVCNHKDGNKLNNHYTNLEWCWPDENSQHAVSTGLRPVGSALSFAKLDETTVKLVRERYRAGESFKSLLDDLGVSKGTLSQLLVGKTWKHVPGAITKEERYDLTCKLNGAEVEEARNAYANGETQTSIAARYGVSAASIWKIIHGGQADHIGSAVPMEDYKALGKSSARAHFSDQECIELQEAYRLGKSQRTLAREYGVSQSMVQRALHKELANGRNDV